MKKFPEPILVTRPYLPDLDGFKRGLEEIWTNRWLSNNGPLVQRFEAKLAEYMGTSASNVSTFVNGTLALEIGFQAMGLATGGTAADLGVGRLSMQHNSI